MVAGDEWTKSAMRDGEVVAEILLRLKEAKVTHHLLCANPNVESLRWGIRQPRSRSPRKEAESAKSSRCSPSTPLSWSGGCGGGSSSSPSAYIDGYEATSRRISGSCTVGSRSKVVVTADLDFDVKRLQRKKDTASLRSVLNEQSMENKNLKKLKLKTQLSCGNLAVDENRNGDGNYLLPDLNMMPCEETGDQYYSLGVENNTIW